MNQLEEKLLNANIDFTRCQSWFEFGSKKIKVGICQGSLSHIIQISSLKQLIIPEQNITEQVIVKEKKKSIPSMGIDELKVGNLLIHSDHGIGRFIGAGGIYESNLAEILFV